MLETLRQKNKKIERHQQLPFAAQQAPLVTTPSRERRRAWLEALLGFLWRSALWLGEGPRLVRHVGPGLRPLDRHEFEDANLRDHRQFGGGPY